MWKYLENNGPFALLIVGIVVVMVFVAVSQSISKWFRDPVVSACHSIVELLPPEQRLEGMAKCLDGADGKIDNVATKVEAP